MEMKTVTTTPPTLWKVPTELPSARPKEEVS